GKRNAQVKKNWLISITGSLLWVLLPCLIIGLILGQPVWALVIGLTLYLAYTLWQTQRLKAWLNQRPGEPPPEARGPWGAVFRSGKRNAQVKKNWLISITGSLLWVLLPCLIIGLILGQPVWALVIGLTLYLAYTLWQTQRLKAWLNQRPGEPPPEARGPWGAVF